MHPAPTRAPKTAFDSPYRPIDRRLTRLEAEEVLRHASSVLDVDVDTLRALRAKFPYLDVPVRLWLLGEEPICVSTQKQADELRAVDKSYRLVTRWTTAPPLHPSRGAVLCPKE